MAEFWYKMVKFKDYPLEKVPEKWRAEVEEMLKVE